MRMRSGLLGLTGCLVLAVVSPAFAEAPDTVSLEELMDVADAGQVMPPKSTWFEPKLRSGMVVDLFED